jgi:hypothetical protein
MKELEALRVKEQQTKAALGLKEQKDGGVKRG